MQAAEIKKNLPQHHKRQNLLTKHTIHASLQGRP